jgi:lipopolysaccharide transport system permease protein
VRDLRLRYRGAGLGYLWSLINPLLLLLTYTVVFSRIMRVNIPDFPLYLGCGILPWIWFTNSVMAGVRSVETGAGLLRRVYFPAQLLPLVHVTSQFVHFLLSLPILLAFLALTGHAPGAPMLALLPLFTVQFTVLAGASLVVSALGVRFQDTEYIVSNLLLIFFFLAPIVYPPEHVPEELRSYLWLNPVAVLVDGYRDILFFDKWPEWSRIGAAALGALGILWLGTTVFDRMRWKFVEQI